jgi:hypothetical protein
MKLGDWAQPTRASWEKYITFMGYRDRAYPAPARVVQVGDMYPHEGCYVLDHIYRWWKEEELIPVEDPTVKQPEPSLLDFLDSLNV